MNTELELRAGDKWENKQYNYKVKILTVIEGFIMARRKKDHPFVEEIRIFIKMYRPETITN